MPQAMDEPMITVPADVGTVPEQAASAGGTSMQEAGGRQAPSRPARQPAVAPRASPQPGSLLWLQRKAAKTPQGADAPHNAVPQDAHERVLVHRRVGDERDSAGSSKARQRSGRERKRAFASLEPSIPSSARAASGSTRSFAFPDGGSGAAGEALCSRDLAAEAAAGAASARVPESTGVHAGLTATVPGADTAAAGPGAQVQEGSAENMVPSAAAAGLRRLSASGQAVGNRKNNSGLSGPTTPTTPESPSPGGAWPAAAPDQALPGGANAPYRHAGGPAAATHRDAAAPALEPGLARKGVQRGASGDAKSLPPPWEALLNPARERAQAASAPQPRSRAAKGSYREAAGKVRGAARPGAVARNGAAPARGGAGAVQGRCQVEPEVTTGAPGTRQGQRGAGLTSGGRPMPSQDAAGKGSEGSSPVPKAAETCSAQAHAEQPALLERHRASDGVDGRPKEEAAPRQSAEPGSKQQAASTAAAGLKTPGRKRQRAADTAAPKERQQPQASPEQVLNTKRRRSSVAKPGSPTADGQRSPETPAELQTDATHLELLVNAAAAAADSVCATPDQELSSARGRKVRGLLGGPNAAAVDGKSPILPESIVKGEVAGRAPVPGRVSKRERSSLKAAKPWWVV